MHEKRKKKERKFNAQAPVVGRRGYNLRVPGGRCHNPLLLDLGSWYAASTRAQGIDLAAMREGATVYRQFEVSNMNYVQRGWKQVPETVPFGNWIHHGYSMMEESDG